MRAMILCAGLGTRLRPFTQRWPKPAIPFLGAPLLRYNLGLLARAGVREVGINTHHLPEVMEATARAEASRKGLGFASVHEPVIQGTGGGIRGLRRFLEDDTFVVFNGDILFALDLSGVIERHRASGAAATLVLLPMPAHEKYAAVECDPAFRIRRIAGHGPGGDALSPWHFTGVHVMSPAVFDFMSAEGEEDINRRVYPRMMEAGLTLRGDVVRGYWSDLGTPSRYLATVMDVLAGRVDVSGWGEDSPFAGLEQRSPSTWVHSSAELPASPGISGPLLVEGGARVEPGVRISSGVHLGHRAEVASGARLERAVVFEDTQVRGEEQLVETLAWAEHRIPAPLST